MEFSNSSLKEIGKKLRLAREHKRFSQKELADMMDVAPTQYGKIERGIAAPSLKTVLKAAHALEISLDELFFERQERKIPFKDQVLIDRMTIISNLSDEDRTVAIQLLDLIVAKKKMKDIVSDIHTLHK